VILDLDGDGKKDLLTGNRPGQLLFYSNVGTDEAPAFSGYSQVEADGEPIVLDAVTGASPRSRPFLTDWNDDGLPDVLIGAGDGKIYLYGGVREPYDIPEPGTGILLGAAGLGLLLRLRTRTSGPRRRASAAKRTGIPEEPTQSRAMRVPGRPATAFGGGSRRLR
jgi:hypothetical protein